MSGAWARGPSVWRSSPTLNLFGDISVLVETHLAGQKQMSLKKLWVGWLYQAPYTTNSRGVAIFIAKTLRFQLYTLQSDPLGRFLFLHASAGGSEVLLLAFYVPPPFAFTVLQAGVAFMAKHPSVPTIWAGDLI